MKMTSIKVVKIEGGTNDELLASFEELDESDDERTSEEGCDVDFRADFGSFFGEWTSAGENRDEKEMCQTLRHPHIPIPPIATQHS